MDSKATKRPIGQACFLQGCVLCFDATSCRNVLTDVHTDMQTSPKCALEDGSPNEIKPISTLWGKADTACSWPGYGHRVSCHSNREPILRWAWVKSLS